jgi:hypothetical protein
VAELTNISTDMARQTDSNYAPFTQEVAGLDNTSRLQNKVNEAELDARAMERELEKLDQMLATSSISKKVVPGPGPAAKKSGAMANVISLAQRIRALQQGMNE